MANSMTITTLEFLGNVTVSGHAGSFPDSIIPVYILLSDIGSIHTGVGLGLGLRQIDMLYHIAGTFEGENFREFRSFVAIRESFFHEIWEHDVLWCSKSEQSVQNFSPSKVSRYTVQRLSNLLSFISPTHPLSSNNFPPPTPPSFLQQLPPTHLFPPTHTTVCSRPDHCQFGHH